MPRPPILPLDGRRMRSAILAVFTVVFTVLEVVSYRSESAVWDEPIHLTAGYAALRAGDYRVDVSHPPAVRLWAALPLLAMPQIAMSTAVIDNAARDRWLFDRAPYDFARTFLYTDNDGDRLLHAARFMIVLLGVGAGYLLFFWADAWLGRRAALLVLAFYAISPNILAHAKLVTTDVGVTALFFAAVYFLWRTSHRVSWANVAGLAISVGLAVTAKFSGIIVGPVVVVLMVLLVWRRRVMSPLTATAIAALIAVTTVATIWATYGFRYEPSPTPGWRFQISDNALVAKEAPVVTHTMGWIDSHQLLPNAFTQGVLLFVSSVVKPNNAYLLGEYSADGWWYYFPLAFLVKAPVPLIVLLAAGVVVLVRDRRKLGLMNIAFVVVPVGAYVIVAVSSTTNIGFRHFLPVYPFLLLIGAAGADRLLAAPARVARWAVVGLLAIWVVTFARVYPDTLTFFNFLAGGPEHGLRYLSDSNLDWGQHLKALKGWMDERDVRHMNLAYFGEADPAYYRMNVTYLPTSSTIGRRQATKPKLPGYVAISATVRSGVYLSAPWRRFYRGFRGREPVADIGHTIRVYWVERWPAPAPLRADETVDDDEVTATADLADALLFGLDWPEEALVQYDAYLIDRPNDARRWGSLGTARVLTKDRAGGILALRRAIALAPGDFGLHHNLASALLENGDLEEAKAEFTRALELNPSNEIAREQLKALQRR